MSLFPQCFYRCAPSSPDSAQLRTHTLDKNSTNWTTPWALFWNYFYIYENWNSELSSAAHNRDSGWGTGILMHRPCWVPIIIYEPKSWWHHLCFFPSRMLRSLLRRKENMFQFTWHSVQKNSWQKTSHKLYVRIGSLHVPRLPSSTPRNLRPEAWYQPFLSCSWVCVYLCGVWVCMYRCVCCGGQKSTLGIFLYHSPLFKISFICLFVCMCVHVYISHVGGDVEIKGQLSRVDSFHYVDPMGQSQIVSLSDKKLYLFRVSYWNWVSPAWQAGQRTPGIPYLSLSSTDALCGYWRSELRFSSLYFTHRAILLPLFLNFEQLL